MKKWTIMLINGSTLVHETDQDLYIALEVSNKALYLKDENGDDAFAIPISSVAMVSDRVKQSPIHIQSPPPPPHGFHG